MSNTTTDQKTIAQVIRENKIKLESDSVDANPHMHSDGHIMKHYRIVLRATVDGKRRQYTTFFSMGMGLKGDPDAASVLDCLISDAACVESARDVRDFVADLGYESMSVARETYKACQREAAALRRMFGEQYDDLLYNTERL